jgi:hypothetical protein
MIGITEPDNEPHHPDCEANFEAYEYNYEHYKRGGCGCLEDCGYDTPEECEEARECERNEPPREPDCTCEEHRVDQDPDPDLYD